MPSPFPGMDPYLEDPAFWEDFHDSFIVHWKESLNAILPQDYRARVNGRTRLMDVTAGEARNPKPDVVVHRAANPARGGGGGAALASIDPVTIPLRFIEEERETYVEILRLPERSVVSVLELLSPSNKAGSDRREYLAKRQAILGQDIHLVELDLLRGGGRVPLRGTVAGDYFQYVSRADRRPDCEVYGWLVSEPMPRVPVPLRSPDGDVIVDLAQTFAETYDRGCYREDLRYAGPPPGDWPIEDEAWIRSIASPLAR